jgi:hypothetical protein
LVSIQKDALIDGRRLTTQLDIFRRRWFIARKTRGQPV